MNIKYVLNKWIKKSPWYTEGDFKDCQKFWDGIPYDLEIINLGSNSAKYGFDYTGLNIRAANLAMGPQCLLMDYNILKTYKNHLKPNAIVLIPICPFSSMAGYNYLIDPKYHTFLPKENIPNYSRKTQMKMMNLMNNPLNSYPLVRFFIDLKNIVSTPFRKRNKQIHFVDDAQKWIDLWMNEFEINSFDDNLSKENLKNLKDSATIVKGIFNYCLDNGFKPYVVLPPIYNTLATRLSMSMREKYIYDYLRKAEIPKDCFLNYIDDKQICADKSYFQNSYFLNASGALEFTRKIISNVIL